MKRQITIFFIAALTIFGVGYAGFMYATGSDKMDDTSSIKPLRAPAASQEGEPQSLVVQSVVGTAERSGGPSQPWHPVVPGNKLLADERIRTEENARVKLVVDDKSKIELSGKSEMNVQEITNTFHKIHLALGQLSVEYTESNDRVLKITADKSQAIAATKAGEFVIQNANGQVSVATTAGQVELSAENETVTVGPNATSYVLPGEAPAAPTPIPLQVMLRVANPAKLRDQERATTISGTTNIGAQVEVNDELATVDTGGRFKIRLPLHAGKNPVEVVSTMPWGSAQKQLTPILVAGVEKEPAVNSVDSAKVRWERQKKMRKSLKPTPAEIETLE